MNYVKNIALLAVILSMVACGGESTTQDNGADVPKPDTTKTDEMSLEEKKAARLVVPDDANVFFANLNDGDTVSSPIHVEMGVAGMGIEPAGEIINGTGHHHILINNASGYLASGEVVPMDSLNLHYGKGQTEADIELAPGSYKLSMQFANGNHESYGERMSTSINITVE